MPRGNDTEAAASELADSFGAGAGNAERLIEANNRARQPLAEANMSRTDEEATAELDISKLKGPDGEEVVSAAVKQNGQTVIAYRDDRGRLHKALHEEKKASKGRGKAKAKADDSDDASDGDE